MSDKDAAPTTAGAGQRGRVEIPEEQGQTFGEYLLRERERRKLTLREAAGAIRIPMRHLEALEDDAYGELPPRTYVRGFLEAYSRYLDLDPQEVHLRFEAALQEEALNRREESRGAIFELFTPRGEGIHWRDWAIPLFIALAVLIFAVGRIFVGSGERGPEISPPLSQTPSSGLEPPAPPSPPEGEVNGAQDAAVAPPRAVGVHIIAQAVASTWMAAQRDGNPVEEWTLRGGERSELTAEKKILLSIGNAGAVQLTYNGRELGFIGHKGQVKRNLVFLAATD